MSEIFLKPINKNFAVFKYYMIKDNDSILLTVITLHERPERNV